MEPEMWLFYSVTFTVNNSVNNVRNLKCSFLNKSATSRMVVLSLPRESYVTLQNDVGDIPMSFQVQLLVEDHVQRCAVLLTGLNLPTITHFPARDYFKNTCSSVEYFLITCCRYWQNSLEKSSLRVVSFSRLKLFPVNDSSLCCAERNPFILT
jgi:hypothetical protein